jgi:beta-glucosidase
VTILEALTARVPEGNPVSYHLGSLLNQPSEAPLWLIDGASRSDVTIACMGITPTMEGEEGHALLSTEQGDRAEISLPAAQVKHLKELAQNGAKVVLVLTGGSPIALGELEDLMHAIVYIWYPGQEGGKAVASVLFGDEVPSGKLPLTFPKSLEQVPPFEDYNMAGRTYRYATEEPLFPFGFGLSYTSFTYSKLLLDKTAILAGESLSLRFRLSNSGSVDADEVAQIYLSDLQALTVVPLNSLIGFQRVHLKAGESTEINFTVSPEMMKLVNDDGERVLEAGEFRIIVGGCSPSERGTALGASLSVSTTFTVTA